ncbi:hypothetical protein [Roseateles puraquae]|uniref:hypothetical protein n=1 Tax=Roseateles puraquae TaxID=431059 RepID=UPI00240805F9|nr:hypothetical protein [Roseateles puraquae]
MSPEDIVDLILQIIAQRKGAGAADGPAADADRVWIISEADRTSTTILQPSEY